MSDWSTDMWSSDLVDGRFLAERGHHVLERPRLGRVIEHVASCDAPDACSASYRVESMEPLGIVRAPAERQGEVAADAKRRSQIGEVSDRIRAGKVRHEDKRGRASCGERVGRYV